MGGGLSIERETFDMKVDGEFENRPQSRKHLQRFSSLPRLQALFYWIETEAELNDLSQI